MKTLSRNMFIGAFLLGGFAIFGSGLLAFIHSTTNEKIAENERQALLNSLNQVIDPQLYDNALEADTIQVNSDALNPDGSSTIYRARKNGQPVAAVMTVIAPDGYSGKIKMLAAVSADGLITGVRVVNHKETPGLGDKIDIIRNDWITTFNGKSLSNPELSNWNVKKDGGVFDSFTGATITPRAVVQAIARSLQYFENHKDTIFEQANP